MKDKRENIWTGIKSYTFGAKGAWGGIAWIIILGFLIAAFAVFNAACLKLLLDIATGDSSMPLLTGTAISLGVIILQHSIKSVYLVAISKTNNKIAASAKARFLNHIERMPQKSLDKFHSGDLLTRLSDDTDIAASVLPDIGSAIFTGLASCILALTYAFYLSWQMALLCVVLMPLPALWSRFMVPFIQKYASMARDGESEVRAFSQEEIAYTPIIKSYTSYDRSVKRFSDKFSKLAYARVKSSTMSAILNGGANIAAFLSFVGAAALGAYLSLKGETTPGTIIGFVQIMNYIVFPVSELGQLVGELQEGRAAMARLREIEDIPCETESEAADIDEDKMELRLSNVAFGYDDEPLFKGADFALKGRQFVGVMGPSGCGKSTLIKLLLALYEPTEGEIALSDGVKSVKGTAIRREIAYVPQDHPLMSGTILENIAYGDESPDLTKAKNAAQKAGISDFIETLPEKYDTLIKEKGDNVSFGQAQRIAIARAIYKDAPVLILDEPTASLDQHSKNLIMATVKAESENRLCIMICHDQTENRDAFDTVLEFEGKGSVRVG